MSTVYYLLAYGSVFLAVILSSETPPAALRVAEYDDVCQTLKGLLLFLSGLSQLATTQM